MPLINLHNQTQNLRVMVCTFPWPWIKDNDDFSDEVSFFIRTCRRCYHCMSTRTKRSQHFAMNGPLKRHTMAWLKKKEYFRSKTLTLAICSITLADSYVLVHSFWQLFVTNFIRQSCILFAIYKCIYMYIYFLFFLARAIFSSRCTLPL